MSDDSDVESILNSPDKPWPRAVALLAVAAHISVTIALWRAPEPIHVTNSNRVEFSLSLLLAQVNLLTLWLVVGHGPAIRRLAWTVCGWSGVAYVLASAASLQSATPFVFAMQPAVTGAIIGGWRVSGRKVNWLPAEPSPGEVVRFRDWQFSILELFSTALGIAIAAAFVTRIDLAATFLPPRLSDSIQALVAVATPAAAMTLVSIIGLRGRSSLSMQMILAGMALLLGLALQTYPRGEWDGLFEIHAAHWFVIAATLWIFQMCGYRLVRTTTKQSADI
jgi:hypothetical protein